MKDPELKQKVEALLFSTGKKMTPDDLARIIRTRDKESIRLVLEELKDEYAGKPGSLFIVEEGEGYKLTVREGYQPVVRRVVADTELPKTVIETLAIIAWRAPVLQSDINKVRTNKVYDDVAILVGQGFKRPELLPKSVSFLLQLGSQLLGRLQLARLDCLLEFQIKLPGQGFKLAILGFDLLAGIHILFLKNCLVDKSLPH